jgi:AcrR family transcriptional regulator
MTNRSVTGAYCGRDKGPLDPRVVRTRSSITKAFGRLLLAQGYPAVTPAMIAATAGVGRSTFYAHFRGVDDVLDLALRPVLAPLVLASIRSDGLDEAQRALEHVWENRRYARALLIGDAQSVVLKSFAGQFATALQAHHQPNNIKPLLAIDLIALQLAAAQLAVLGAWLSGRFSHSASAVAAAMQASAHAAICVLLPKTKAVT